MKTRCPKCQRIFSIKPAMVGRRGKCPKCQHVFAIAEWNAPQPKADGSSGVESPGTQPPSIVEPPPSPHRSNRKNSRSGGGRTLRIFLLSTVTCVPLGILFGFLIRASLMDSPEPQASATRAINLSTQPREDSNVPQRSTGQASKPSPNPDLTANAPPTSALHAFESSSAELEADPATTADQNAPPSDTQSPPAYLPILGQWEWAYGRPWAESINIIYGGAVHVHERDANNGRRIIREGTLVIKDRNSFVFLFESAPALNLEGTFAIDGEAIRLTVDGEEIVMARPNRVALYREQAKREGTMSKKSESDQQALEQPDSPDDKDYGPVIRGDAYLLLGEWVNRGTNRKGPYGVAGVLGRLALLEDGTAVYSVLNANDGTEGTPTIGKYRVNNDQTLVLEADFLRGGQQAYEYIFTRDGLFLRDPAQKVSALALHRLSPLVNRTPLVKGVPELARKSHTVDGHLALAKALRENIVTLGTERSFRPTASSYEQLMRMSASSASFGYPFQIPGRLTVSLEPGLPVLASGSGLWVIAEIHSQNRKHAALPNTVVLGTSGSYAHQTCLVRLLPLRSQQSKQDGLPRGVLVTHETEELRIPGLSRLLSQVDFVSHDDALALMGRFLGSVWTERDLKSFRTQFTNLSPDTPHWKTATALAAEALEVSTAKDTVNSALVGLWLPTAESTALSIRQNLNRFQPTLPGVNPLLMPQSRLVLHRNGRFTFLIVDPKSDPTMPDRGLDLIRLRGEWQRTGATVICTVEKPTRSIGSFEQEQLLYHHSFKVRIKGEVLELVGLQGGSSGIQFERYPFPNRSEVTSIITNVALRPVKTPNEKPDSQHAHREQGQSAPAVTPTEKGEQPSKGAHVAVGPLPGKPGWTRIALRGDPVPGSELKNPVFRKLGIPVINLKGDVGFAATIEGQKHVRLQQQQALFAVHGDRLTIQAEMTSNTRRTNDPPSVNFGDLQDSHLTEPGSWCHPLHIDSQGRLLLRGTINPLPKRSDTIAELTLSGAQVTGYVRIDRGAVEPIIMAGQPAAEVPGTAWLAKSEYGADDRLLLCADDEVMFTGQTWKGRERGVDGVWKGAPENVRLIALNRGRLPDGKYAYGFLAIPVGRGEAAAHGQFLDDPNARDARSGFWIGPPTNWRLIAEEGKPLPGVGDKRVVEHLRVTGSNHRGDVLLEIGFLGGPSKSLWKYTDGRFVPLPTPSKSEMRGLPTNSAWGIRRAVINSSGDVAVIMSTSVGGSGFLKQSLETLWLWTGDEVRLLLRDDQIQDIPGVAKVSGLGTTLSMNSNSQILITPADSYAWLVGADGKLHEIVRVGEAFDFGSGDRRIVLGTQPALTNKREIKFPSGGGEDGRPRCLTDDGKLALRLFFDDGSSGLFMVQAASDAGP